MNSEVATAKLEKQLTNISAGRRKKIAKLKNKVDSGKYKIDNLALAKALFMAR